MPVTSTFLFPDFFLCNRFQIAFPHLSLHGIHNIDTAVAHSVDVVDDAVVRLSKFCLTFSFTDTFYMGFSHFNTKIKDFFFLFQDILCGIGIAAYHHLHRFGKHFLDQMQAVLHITHGIFRIFIFFLFFIFQ